MGHNRLGRLPKTLRWREVVGLLDDEHLAVDTLAAAVLRAADHRFRRLVDDPTLGYCLWLLARITWAARGENFSDDLGALGIDANALTSPVALIAELGDHVRREAAGWPASDDFAELSAQALRQALTETVAQEGPSLFGGSEADLQRAFAVYATRARFGELARRFFAAFMSRSLRSFVDRELANHVGRTQALANISSSGEFMRALDAHVWQTAKIVEDFAGGWYSKHNWETKGHISPSETQQFLAVALRKLRFELRIEGKAR